MSVDSRVRKNHVLSGVKSRPLVAVTSVKVGLAEAAIMSATMRQRAAHVHALLRVGLTNACGDGAMAAEEQMR